MRIITGIYKGRHFDIPRTFKARPTTDFAKENIFNVLNGYIDFEDCSALDLFSGTGSITLELLSRGCSSVVSVEADKDHHAFIRQCLKKLGTDDCIPLRAEVHQGMPPAVRLYLCRPTLCLARTATAARPHLQAQHAQCRWRVCV